MVIIRIKYYIRYADDFVILDTNKQNLTELLSKIEIDMEIPPELYTLVAEVLFFIYQLDRLRQCGADGFQSRAYPAPGWLQIAVCSFAGLYGNRQNIFGALWHYYPFDFCFLFFWHY